MILTRRLLMLAALVVAPILSGCNSGTTTPTKTGGTPPMTGGMSEKTGPGGMGAEMGSPATNR